MTDRNGNRAMGQEESDGQRLEGRNAVIEAFRSGRTIERLYVQDGLKDGPILTILREGSQSAGDLARMMDMPPSKLSYHLGKLKKAELIYETRRKNFLIYDLNLTVLDEAILYLHSLKGGCES